MSSNTQTSRSHESKNPRGHDEDSGEVIFTPRNPSKPQSSKKLSASARPSCESPSSSDRDELQEPTLQTTPMKFSVEPRRETENEYENEAYDDFRLSLQQSFQSAHHDREENPFDEDEDVFISDYQSNSKPSRCHKTLEEKWFDLKMLKEKDRNLEL